MKWRDAETIDVYEHIYDEEKYRDLHESLIRTYSIREKEYLQNKKEEKNHQSIKQLPFKMLTLKKTG